MGDRMGGNLVTHSVHVLDGGVVCVLVRHKESGLNITAIGIPPSSEDLIIKVDVVVVDGIVKSYCDHLWNPLAVIIVWTEISWHLRPVLRAEAVGQLADLFVAWRGAVGIIVDI